MIPRPDQSAEGRKQIGLPGPGEEPRKPFILDWGPFLLFCGIGTFVFTQRMGWAGALVFYGAMTVFLFAIWLYVELSQLIFAVRVRPCLPKVISDMDPSERRKSFRSLPSWWRRQIVKQRLSLRRRRHRRSG